MIAPLRALGLPPGPSYVIERDGERVGYIGRNPLSGNLEYFVRAAARGGVGKAAVTAFLAEWRSSGDWPGPTTRAIAGRAGSGRPRW